MRENRCSRGGFYYLAILSTTGCQTGLPNREQILQHFSLSQRQAYWPLHSSQSSCVNSCLSASTLDFCVSPTQAFQWLRSLLPLRLPLQPLRWSSSADPYSPFRTCCLMLLSRPLVRISQLTLLQKSNWLVSLIVFSNWPQASSYTFPIGPSTTEIKSLINR